MERHETVDKALKTSKSTKVPASASKLHHLLEVHERQHQAHCDAHEDFLSDMQNVDGLLEHCRNFQKRALDYWLFRNNRYVTKLTYLLPQATAEEQAPITPKIQGPKTLEEFERSWLNKQIGDLESHPHSQSVLAATYQYELTNENEQGD